MKIILIGTEKELDKYTIKIERDYKEAYYTISDYYEVMIDPKLKQCEITLEDF